MDNKCALRAFATVTTFLAYNSQGWANNELKVDNPSETIVVSSPAITASGDTPPTPLPGNQVAAGGRVGVFGERESLDIPFNIYSFTNDFINDQQANTLGDVLRNDASIVVGKSAGDFSEAFKFRGFNLSGSDISYGGLYGVLPSKIVNTNLLGRVELLKGASTFVNGVSAGSGGVGGSVNIEPKHADDKPLTRLSTSYENKEHGELGFDIGRRFGDSNEYGVRISGSHEAGEKAIDNDRRKSTSGVLGLDYRGERLKTSFDVGYEKDVFKGGNMALGFKEPGAPGWGSNYTNDKLPSPPKASANYSPDWGAGENITKFFLLRGEYILTSNWTGYAAIGGNKSDIFNREASVDIYNYSGLASTGFMDTYAESNSLAGQIGFRGDFQTAFVSHKINVGYSSVYTRLKQFMSYDAGSTEYNIFSGSLPSWHDISKQSGVNEVLNNIGSPGVKQRVSNKGVSFSDEFGFLDDTLLLTLGGRYQIIENRGYNTASSDIEHDDNLPAGAEVNHYREQQVTPIYGVVYKVTPTTSLYANHVEGLQPANVAPTSVKDFPYLNNPGQSPGVVKSRQNEIGLNYNNDKIGGNISLFEIKQPRAVVNQAGTHYGFYDEIRNRGLELSLYGAPIDEIRLYSSASWTDAKITESEGGVGKGNTPPGIPDYQLVAGGEWDLPFNRNLTATGRVIHTGSQYLSESNRLKLEPWTRLDLGLRYMMKVSNKKIIWRASVENVTNKSYWASAATDGNSRLSVGEPRTFKLSMAVDF
ncbi:TonB-dependent receptor [Erwinia rhapontici]|uniref:TonB-dependent receptor n=1 Tax=Erwinia rhapontici TaxID=55212 RepID=UPI003BA0F49C